MWAMNMSSFILSKDNDFRGLVIIRNAFHKSGESARDCKVTDSPDEIKLFPQGDWVIVVRKGNWNRTTEKTWCWLSEIKGKSS